MRVLVALFINVQEQAAVSEPVAPMLTVFQSSDLNDADDSLN